MTPINPNDPGVIAAVREIESQRGAIADLLGSRAAELARLLALTLAENEKLRAELALMAPVTTDLKG